MSSRTIKDPTFNIYAKGGNVENKNKPIKKEQLQQLAKDVEDLKFDFESGISDYVIREPVSYDNKGVYIFDKQNKKLRINFSYLGEKSTDIICDPDFHPPFFAI